MTRTAFKAAASTCIVAMTMAGFSSQSDAMRRMNDPVRATSPDDRRAAALHEQGARALQAGQMDAARAAIEQAVALSPRDAGYRQLLADIYLKSGRFSSARTTYADVLELDPSNVRAALSVALIQIAQGNPRAAVTRLDDLAGRAPDADVGLAYALAGQHERAIRLLERAARRPGATARIRQNLALAYAMSGDWRRAQAIAAQDLSPSEVPVRMVQWAAFARPGSGPVQVAGILGVTPTEDPGQPVRLALSGEAAPAFAEVAAPEAIVAAAGDPPAPAAAPEPVTAPVQVVEAQPTEAPAFWVPTAQSYQAPVEAPVEAAQVSSEPPPPAPEVQVQYASAARSLTTPEPALIRAAATRVPAPIFHRERPRITIRDGQAPVVVQLGAFSNEGNAERAWLQVSSRYSISRVPLTTTITVNGRQFHRVSVSGFASAGDAQRLCGQIRERGGSCFVRGTAGDASIRWAARYANPRQRDV
ncbi:MAG TPA: tetratricopeptide repeat protein [Allosphingosinicella sp.]|nr:tetratricopeptide repeat protein [Allosphingosinicella sp.]